MSDDNEIHMGSAEEGIGTAILDMLAQEHCFNGVFFVSVDDDGGFSIQMLDVETNDDLKIEDFDAS